MGTLEKGMFRDNPLIVHLAGLAPALMVTTHLVYGFVIGIGVLGVTVAAVSTLYPLKQHISPRIELTATLIVLALYVTLFQRILALINPYLMEKLWVFLPILAVNCVILYSMRFGNAGYLEAMGKSLGRALGYAGALLIISVIRELLAFGTLTFSAEPVGGQVVRVLPAGPIALAGYLAGGFMLLGYLRAIVQRSSRKREVEQ